MATSTGYASKRPVDARERHYEVSGRLNVIRRLIQTWREGAQPDTAKLLEGIDGLCSSAQEWMGK